MSRSVKQDYEGMRERQAKVREPAEAITADAFLAAYAERSGTTPAEILALGRFVKPCSCPWEYCEGWQLAYPDDNT